jgi:hypothetical protein
MNRQASTCAVLRLITRSNFSGRFKSLLPPTELEFHESTCAYWMSSVAWARTDCGIVRPSA